MKTKMLIFVFLLGITDLFAQTLYVPGAIVKGKNASYYCAFENKLVVRVYNVNKMCIRDSIGSDRNRDDELLPVSAGKC